VRLLRRLHAGVAMGLGCPLVGRWYNPGAGLVVLVVGPVPPLVRRWYNPGAAAPWALPGAERGQAG